MTSEQKTPAAPEGMRAVTKKSALPIWGAAAVWLIAALFLPMTSVGLILLYAAISAAVWLVLSKLIKPTVTYEPIPEEKKTTGNAELDAKVEEINESVRKIAAAAAAAGEDDPALATDLYSIANTATAIRDDIIEDPKDLPRCRRLLNYYLPTTVKLTETYDRLRRLPADGASNTTTLQWLFDTPQSIETFRFDSLFDNEALDVATDIDVLDAMLTRDGLTGGMTETQS